MDAELEMIDAAEAHEGGAEEDDEEDLDALLEEDEVVDRGAPQAKAAGSATATASASAVKQDDEVSLEDAGDEEDW
jgi:hypothetical protein